MSASSSAVGPRDPWPALPWQEWQPTISTLHLWLQIVGKVRMALAPPLNHWWHTTLYLSARGLTTSAISYRRGQFQVDLDFIDHQLRIDDSEGRSFTMALEPKSVASFYREFMDGLRSLGIEVRIWSRPVEVVDATPFESDAQHASYDPDHVRALWGGLSRANRVMQTFQSGFVGKASPVHVFWGSFDLATSRYSGRPAPRHQGGAPNCPDWVMEEAYSREEVSVGWWPSSEPPGPSFYAYTYPEPEGFRAARVAPAEASFDPRLGEFILPEDAIRHSPDPDALVLAFFESTYAAGADLGGWDRSALEPAVPPRRPADRPWSTIADVRQPASQRSVSSSRDPAR